MSKPNPLFGRMKDFFSVAYFLKEPADCHHTEQEHRVESALIWHLTLATSDGTAGAPCWATHPWEMQAMFGSEQQQHSQHLSTQGLILSRPLATVVWPSTPLLNLVGISVLRYTFLGKTGAQTCACTNPCFPQHIFTVVFPAQSRSE